MILIIGGVPSDRQRTSRKSHSPYPMFKKKSKKQLMEFSRPPKLSGKVNVCVGLPLTALWLLRCWKIDCWYNGTTIFSYIVLLLMLSIGIYRWAFRKGAISDTVTLGGFSNRMYLRYRQLYMPVGIAAGFLLIFLFTTLPSLISYGIKGLSVQTFSDDLTTFGWMYILVLYKVLKSYVDFYEYYRSSEASRKKVD